MRYPVYVDGNISVKQLQDALHPLGFHLRIDAGHRFIIDPLPNFLLKAQGADEKNVVQMQQMKGKKR